MAPKRQKNTRTSGDSETLTRPQTVTTKSPARTPSQSPRKKMGGITVAQKQALIDNLQLEVTERARKLRAQYVLQAQSLRTRIELRVNRIPTAMRKANMGELLEKYTQMNDTKASGAKNQVKELPGPDPDAKPPVLDNRPKSSNSADSAPPPPRSLKRTSDQISTDGDKENASSAADLALPNPKKRSKAATSARAPVNGNAVLSPKSANSRTIPRRQQQEEEEKGDILPAKPSRQTSPLKPTISATTAAAVPISPAKATAMLSSMLATARAPAQQSNGNNNAATKPKTAATTRATKPPAAPSATRQASATATARGVNRRHPPPPPSITADVNVRKASNTSTLSTTSASTTIVKSAAPAARARGGRAAAAAATTRATATAAGRKAGAAPATAGAARGRRAVGAGDDAGSATAKGTGTAAAGVKEGRRVLRKR